MFACAMTIDQFILSSLSHQCISSVPLAGNARSSKIISRAPWHLVVRSKYTSCTILILNAQRWRLASTFLLLRIRLQGSYISLSSIDFYSDESMRRLVCVCVPIHFGRCPNMAFRNAPFNSTISMFMPLPFTANVRFDWINTIVCMRNCTCSGFRRLKRI